MKSLVLQDNNLQSSPLRHYVPRLPLHAKRLHDHHSQRYIPASKRGMGQQTYESFISALSESAPTEEKEKITLELENLLNSLNVARLDIKEVGNCLKPRFNVYADGSKITYNKLWTRLRTFLIGRTYASTMEGQGIAEKAPYICMCCHGVNHPRGLCPFPGLTGWNSPRREGNGELIQRRMGGPPFPDQCAQRQCFASHT